MKVNATLTQDATQVEAEMRESEFMGGSRTTKKDKRNLRENLKNIKGSYFKRFCVDLHQRIYLWF